MCDPMISSWRRIEEYLEIVIEERGGFVSQVSSPDNRPTESAMVGKVTAVTVTSCNSFQSSTQLRCTKISHPSKKIYLRRARPARSNDSIFVHFDFHLLQKCSRGLVSKTSVFLRHLLRTNP